MNKVQKFKYLDEVFQKNGLYKEANGGNMWKMEIVYQLSKNIYNTKSISIGVKINTVIKPQAL